MNQKLRARHRRMITVLALVTPAVFAAALLARPGASPVADIPASSGNKIPVTAVLLGEESLVLDDAALTARLFQHDADHGRGLGVQLTPAPGHAVGGADVLVYWHDGDSNGQIVPDDAVLVGTLAGPQTRVLDLPAGVSAGELLFYSLAQQRLYDERWSLPK